MRRRDFVKGILSASAAARGLAFQRQTTAPPAAPPAAPHLLPPQAPVAPGPTPWMRGLMEVKPLKLDTLVPDAVAQTDAHFFNETETATLKRLCALLMPPIEGFPGAVDVATPEFLDFLIGASPRARQMMYRSGLDWLDAQAKGKYAAPFAKTDDAQADALIRPWLRTWMGELPPTELHAGFVNQVHVDIRTATVNSQPWRDAAREAGLWETGLDLYWYPVDPDIHGPMNPAMRRPPAMQTHAAAVAHV
jgi:hypothetical protein